MGKLLSYCRRVGLHVAGEREDPDWGVFIDLFPCPFKGPGHEDGGNPAILVHPDGGHSFHCFHVKCLDKKWADIEDSLRSALPDDHSQHPPELCRCDNPFGHSKRTATRTNVACWSR